MSTFMHPGHGRTRRGLLAIAAAVAGPALLERGAMGQERGPVHLAHTEQGFVPGSIIAPYNELFQLTEASAGGFQRPLYIAIGDGRQLVTLSEAGEIDRVADLSPISLSSPPWKFSVDQAGGYGGSLFINDDANHVYEIGADGMISLFATNGDGQAQHTALQFDPYGAFAGCLFLTETGGSLQRIEPWGDMTLVATGLGGAEHFMAFSPGGAFGENLYIADAATRRIFRIASGHVPGEPAPVWVDLAAEAPGFVPVRLAINASGRSGVLMHVYGAGPGQVLVLAADGSLLAESNLDFEEPPSVETPRWKADEALDLLAQWGRCIDCTDCPGDLDGDCFVGRDDLEALLDEEP